MVMMNVGVGLRACPFVLRGQPQGVTPNANLTFRAKTKLFLLFSETPHLTF